MNTKSKIRNMALTAVITAIICIMANVPFLGYIPLGVTRATIIHVPVIIGAILLGPKYGAFLGFVFGFTSLIVNTFNPTVTSFVFSPFYSIGGVGGNLWSLVICFVPRILVGVVAYYVYKFVKKRRKNSQKGDLLALSIAALAGSLTNTLLVMNMIYLFFGEPYAAAKNTSINALYGLILLVIGTNGVPEAIVAAILTTGITKVLLRIHKD